jgi:hypothetical protein
VLTGDRRNRPSVKKRNNDIEKLKKPNAKSQRNFNMLAFISHGFLAFGHWRL